MFTPDHGWLTVSKYLHVEPNKLVERRCDRVLCSQKCSHSRCAKAMLQPPLDNNPTPNLHDVQRWLCTLHVIGEKWKLTLYPQALRDPILMEKEQKEKGEEIIVTINHQQHDRHLFSFSWISEILGACMIETVFYRTHTLSNSLCKWLSVQLRSYVNADTTFRSKDFSLTARTCLTQCSVVSLNGN